jgi:hypothetical protein
MLHRRERVRIETERHVIHGTLQLPQEGYRSRLTDFLNAHGTDFLPVTDAELHLHGATGEPERHDYAAISTRHIVLVVELGPLGVVDDAG